MSLIKNIIKLKDCRSGTLTIIMMAAIICRQGGILNDKYKTCIYGGWEAFLPPRRRVSSPERL